MALWTAKDVAAATGGASTAAWTATGVSIDSRSVAAGDLFVALARDDDEGHARLVALQLRDERRAAAVLQLQVEDHQIRRVPVEPRARFFRGAGGADLVVFAAQRFRHKDEQALVVIDDEDVLGRGGHGRPVQWAPTGGTSIKGTNNPMRRIASANFS